MNKKELKGIIEMSIAALLISFNPILIKLTNNLNSYNLSFFKVFIAALSIFIFIGLTNKKLTPFKFEKKKLLFFGFLHGFIILGYFFAIQKLTISSAVFLFYAFSIWMVLLSHFILKEKIKPITWLALIIAIIGLLFVTLPKDILNINNLIASSAGLLAGFGAAIVYLLSRTFKHYDKVSLTFWQNFIAIPFVFPLLIFNIPKGLTFIDISIIILMGSLFTALPFVLVFRGLQKLGNQKGGFMVLIKMISPIILAIIFFSEYPSLNVIIGGSLIIIGLVLALLSKRNGG